MLRYPSSCDVLANLLSPWSFLVLCRALSPFQELSKGPKLVLRADSEQQLLQALEAARAAGIPYHSIAEAVPGSSSGGGSSSDVVVPRKSRTILAIGPLPAEDLPKVAGGLVLL
jgi:peptidyl-tRNA hydrolase